MTYLKNIEEKEIEIVAKEIKKGKIVIFPTETVYGIGTNVFCEEACKRIYDIKNRPKDKPLIVLIDNINMIYDMVEEINDTEKKLIDNFWPGALTIIFPQKSNSKVSKTVTAGKSNIGIRMTNGKIAKKLIQIANIPIVAPSANLSGKPSGTKIESIKKDLGSKVDYIIDCGDIKNEEVSTIVKVEDEIIYIIRQGKIKKEQLEKIAKVIIN